ncbi:Putative protein of unknown function [Podospora comata]|uniref:Uncharacterized protein n=1 Tax=Podospora comata TaxID=48703 RepID=A0ABY6S8P6_PODCO|nr:Putative protein of unknown function [Podospora comata]
MPCLPQRDAPSLLLLGNQEWAGQTPRYLLMASTALNSLPHSQSNQDQSCFAFTVHHDLTHHPHSQRFGALWRMSKAHSLLRAFLTMTQFVHAAPATLGLALDDVDDFTIVPVYLELPIKPDDPNGATVTVEGTIQQAIAKMDTDYPGWNQTFQAGLGDVSYVSASLAALAALEGPTYDCKIKTDMANSLAIKWGIHYLRAIPGKAKNGPGPKNCGRVSCSWDSAIYWCNEVCCHVSLLCVMMSDRSNTTQDSSGDKELYWGQIADLAQGILDNCAGLTKVKGQGTYKDDKWSVVVRFPKGSEGNC